ncbi:MAG: CDP-alcohol phosphatidyltransferase family protein, partial [Bacilli bacterium]|nr:CDP-alcohol phosphatidyltransferase family protein [Bacilli bacterium]
LITFIRSLGSIAIIPIYLTGGSLAAGLATIGFFATDCIDGFLARRLHVQSFFGSLLDGLSDKAFGIVCLLLLSTVNPIFLAVIGVELGILAVNYKSIERGNNAKSSIAGKAKTVFLAASIVGSFFCHAAPTVKEMLNYINITSLNTLLEKDPTLLSTILAVPTIGASLYVAADYMKKATTQDKERENLITSSFTEELAILEEENPEDDERISLDEIQKRKVELMRQKEEVKELKSRSELIHDLFDTDFYLEHKDDGIKRLFYKNKGSE